jgi:hypothetical protein
MLDIFEQPLDIAKIIIHPSFEEMEGYALLPLRNVTAGWKVPFEEYLKTKEKEKMKPTFIRCCERGDVFKKDWYEKLLQLGIPCVYVSLEEMDRVLQYFTKAWSNLWRMAG